MNYRLLYLNLLLGTKHTYQERPAGIYTERHHIQPRCLGGSNRPDNLVYLTPRVHFIAHRLLQKMYPSHAGLRLAVTMMSKSLEIKTGRCYQKLRQQLSQEQMKSRPVSTPRGTFPSVGAAARAYKLTKSAMVKRLRSTSFSSRFFFYADEGRKKTPHRTTQGLKQAKPLRTPKGYFVSVREAAPAHGVSPRTLDRWCRDKRKPRYRYIKVNREKLETEAIVQPASVF